MEKRKEKDVDNYFYFKDWDKNDNDENEELLTTENQSIKNDKKEEVKNQTINISESNKKSVSKEDFKKQFLEKEKNQVSNKEYKDKERKNTFIKTIDIIATCVFVTLYACFFTVGISVYLGLQSNKKVLEEIGYFSKSDEFEQLINFFDSQILQILIQPYEQSQEMLSTYIAIPGLILIVLTMLFFVTRYTIIKRINRKTKLT